MRDPAWVGLWWTPWSTASYETSRSCGQALRGRSEIRILFVFDPGRQAILLVAGDKAGRWSHWYEEAIPLAERRYADWLAGRYEEGDR